MVKPIFQNNGAAERRYMDKFGGLCRTEEITDGEFAQMRNMSSERFPYLAPCRTRKEICAQEGIECAISPKLETGKEVTAFTGVADNKFYYDGAVKLGLSPQEMTRSLVDFNGNILILPDCKYYSYVDDSSGDIAASMTATVRFYEADEEEENKIVCPDGFGELFAKGDSLSISCSEEKNCTYQVASKYEQAADGEIISCIVSGVVSDTTLEVSCWDRNGERVHFVAGEYAGTKISRAMPEIVMACVSNNRVFGADRYGETIYASKLGDFKNWNVFEGLSTDSWYGSVGTEGPFTALASLGSTVVAFKHNYIHQIYGETPNNFSIPKQIAAGCIDGRSVTEIRGQLYFLSYDGVYVFTGGNPVKISAALDTKWSGGVGGTDGLRYYFSAEGAEGTELLVYDLERGLWHREDEFSAVGFIRYNDKLYAADSGALYEMNAGDVGQWYAVSKRFDGAAMDKHGAMNLYFRIELGEGSEVYIDVSSDGGEFIRCATVRDIGRGVVRIPVRFRATESYQIKVSGKGNAAIMAMEKVVYRDGRNESNRMGGR